MSSSKHQALGKRLQLTLSYKWGNLKYTSHLFKETKWPINYVNNTVQNYSFLELMSESQKYTSTEVSALHPNFVKLLNFQMY